MFDLSRWEPEAAAVLALPLDACTPAQLVDRIAAAERLSAAMQADQLRSVQALDSARTTADRGLPGVGARLAGRTVPAEVACARGVAPSTARYQIELAQLVVADHPRLLDCLAAGRVSLAGVRKVVDETVLLEPEQRREVDANLAEVLVRERLTPAKLAEAAARQVIAADSTAATRRCLAARKQRAVSMLDKHDGTATLWTKLTAEEALTCHRTLNRDARALRKAGDQRSLNDLMCDLLVQRLTEPQPSPMPLSRRLRRRASRRVELQVVMAASTLLGVDDAPATLRGYGAIPAELARAIADGPDTALRRLICDPIDGRLLTMDTHTRCYEDGVLRLFVEWRDQVCRMVGCNAPSSDIDHLLEHLRGGSTTAANGQALNLGCHIPRSHPAITVGVKQRRAWTLDALRDAAPTITWTMPTGHTYDSRPPPALGWGSTYRTPPKAKPDTFSVLETRFEVAIWRHRLDRPPTPPQPPQRM